MYHTNNPIYGIHLALVTTVFRSPIHTKISLSGAPTLFEANMFSTAGHICSKLAGPILRLGIILTFSQHIFPSQKSYYNGLTHNETSKRLKVGPASADDRRIITELANIEQRNPGLNDIECYYAADSNNFWMAKLDGKPAACTFLVR